MRCSYEASCLSGYLKGGLDKLNGVSSEDGPEKGEMQAEDPERLFRLPPGPCISAETLRCLVDELEHTAIRRKVGDGDAAGARETRIDLKTLAVADFFALHRAARFFDAAHLELQLVLHLASRLRGKTAQQIRDEFSIAADLDEQQEQTGCRNPCSRPQLESSSAKMPKLPVGLWRPAHPSLRAHCRWSSRTRRSSSTACVQWTCER